MARKQEEIEDPIVRRNRILFFRVRLIAVALALLLVATFIHETAHSIVYLEYGVHSTLTLDFSGFRTIPDTGDVKHLCEINLPACEDLRLIQSQADVEAYQVEYPIFILVFMIYMLTAHVAAGRRQ